MVRSIRHYKAKHVPLQLKRPALRLWRWPGHQGQRPGLRDGRQGPSIEGLDSLPIPRVPISVVSSLKAAPRTGM